MQPVLMAKLMRRYNTARIAQWRGFMGTWKPLDAATRWVLTLYCPSGCQGNSKQNNNKKLYHNCEPFWQPCWCAGTVPGALPNRGGPGLQLKSLVTAIRQVLLPIIAISNQYAGFSKFFHCHFATKGIKVMSRPLITIGVWHIKLTRKCSVTQCDT